MDRDLRRKLELAAYSVGRRFALDRKEYVDPFTVELEGCSNPEALSDRIISYAFSRGYVDGTEESAWHYRSSMGIEESRKYRELKDGVIRIDQARDLGKTAYDEGRPKISSYDEQLYFLLPESCHSNAKMLYDNWVDAYEEECEKKDGFFWPEVDTLRLDEVWKLCGTAPDSPECCTVPGLREAVEGMNALYNILTEEADGEDYTRCLACPVLYGQIGNRYHPLSHDCDYPCNDYVEHINFTYYSKYLGPIWRYVTHAREREDNC